jgi:hypothetical protein
MKDYNSWTVRTILAGHKNGLKWKFSTYRTRKQNTTWIKYHTLTYGISSVQGYTIREVIRRARDRNFKYTDTVMQ